MTLSIAGNNPLKLVVQVRHFQSFLMLFFVAIDLVSELLSWKPTGTFIHPPPLSLTSYQLQLVTTTTTTTLRKQTKEKRLLFWSSS